MENFLPNCRRDEKTPGAMHSTSYHCSRGHRGRTLPMITRNVTDKQSRRKRAIQKAESFKVFGFSLQAQVTQLTAGMEDLRSEESAFKIASYIDR